jgi:hypothetical protein
MTERSGTLAALTAYSAQSYEGVNLNWLALLAVSAVEENQVELSLEHIVMAAFRLFPRKFSLLAYPDHPDAIRVDKALRRCTDKDRQWLAWRTRQGFAITERGRQQLELARRALQQDYRAPKRSLPPTRRWEKLLAEVRTAPAFGKYSRGERDNVSEAECCHVLQGTLDTQRRILRNNLTQLREIAESLQQSEVVAFMDWLGLRFARFLEMGEGHGGVRHTG